MSPYRDQLREIDTQMVEALEDTRETPRDQCQQEPKSAPVSGTEKCTTRRSKTRPVEGCGGFSRSEP